MSLDRQVQLSHFVLNAIRKLYRENTCKFVVYLNGPGRPEVRGCLGRFSMVWGVSKLNVHTCLRSLSRNKPARHQLERRRRSFVPLGRCLEFEGDNLSF